MSRWPTLASLVVAALVHLPAGADAGADLAQAARAQIGVTVRYDGSYRRLAYPGGDVSADRGVCTDVVVRAYRRLGVDLQQRVHEDMRAAWNAYPHPAGWRLKSLDANIDHRRVPNLATFFRRHGSTLAPSDRGADYRPGDIVTWKLPGGLDHIGIVADALALHGAPLVIHNIGHGAVLEDILFAFTISGHYRYAPRSR